MHAAWSQRKRVVVKPRQGEESDFVPYPREVREGHTDRRREREREARDSSRQLSRTSCSPLLARQLELALGPA